MTPETFAKWKKERLDKKAGEEEARLKKEATGRAMFEKGDWEGSDVDSDDEEGLSAGAFNLAALRRETELARQKKEEERLAAIAGTPVASTLPVRIQTGDAGYETHPNGGDDAHG